MALLKPVHWEVISVQMQDILKYIGSCAWVKRFYLRMPIEICNLSCLLIFPGRKCKIFL